MSVSAKVEQLVQIRLPHDAPSRPVYGSTPFMTEYTLTLDDAAKLLADLRIAVLGA